MYCAIQKDYSGFRVLGAGLPHEFGPLVPCIKTALFQIYKFATLKSSGQHQKNCGWKILFNLRH